MKKHYKYIIIGAGPAGMQMAYFLKKRNLDYIVLERNNQGQNFFSKFPIHRQLISINKKYNFFPEEEFNLRHDWNSLLSEEPDKLKMTDYSDELYPKADVYAKYLADYAIHNQLNILNNAKVKRISKSDDDKFIIELENGEQFEATILIMATGALRQNMPEEIEGIEHTIPYEEVEHNKEKYRNKRLAIIGGGNSALETANSLSDTTIFVHLFVKRKIQLSHETHFVGHTRAKYTNIFDMFHLKSLHGILNPRIRKITKLPNGCLQTQHEYDYPESKLPGTLKLTREYDYIINCSGFKYTHVNVFDETITPDVVMNNKFYALNDTWESTNIKNLYCIGTLMQAIDRKSSSGFIHGYRYNIRTLSKLLLEKYESENYPYETFQIYPFKDFLKKLYTRFSIGDGIYQLFGFLGDKLVFNSETLSIDWYKELPVNLIKNSINPNLHTFILTLEFGFHHYPNMSSLDFMKPSDPNNTEKSAFLHPVVRHYFNNKVEEFHFGDSLLGRWDMTHAEGGAIASYHAEFYNWMATILNLEEVELTEIGEHPDYEIWVEDQLN